jgi:hypothetical protein
MWLSGPITTVHYGHICQELAAAVARVGLATRRWLSDKSRSAAVVLGNHPISVGRMVKVDKPAVISRQGIVYQANAGKNFLKAYHMDILMPCL